MRSYVSMNIQILVETHRDVNNNEKNLNFNGVLRKNNIKILNIQSMIGINNSTQGISD